MFDLAKMAPIKRHWITKNSNIPMRYMRWGFADIERTTRKVPEDLNIWMEDLLEGRVIMDAGGLGTTGVGILLDGEPGRGKTTHAVSVLNEFVRGIPDDDSEARKLLRVQPGVYGHNLRPIYYMTFTDFLYRKKALFNADNEDRRRLQLEMDGFHGRASEDQFNVRVLVLDDLGKEYGSKYDDYSFDDILRTRYDKGLPTIMTTNVKLEKWKTEYSDAMASFAHEAFIRIKLEGDDLRRNTQ